MGSDAGVPTLARQAAEYLKVKYHKPGNVFVGIVSRIDRLVSGVLVLARTSKAASRISDQLRTRAVEKRYLACIRGRLPKLKQRGQWTEFEHFVHKNESLQRMQIVPSTTLGAQAAQLRLRCLNTVGAFSLLEVDLITGRKHQIRVQMEALGYPLLGDAKYGSQESFGRGIALHCHRLSLTHPTQKQPLVFRARPDAHWLHSPRAHHSGSRVSLPAELLRVDEWLDDAQHASHGT